MNELRKDMCPSWGLPGAPLLPASLRRAWAQVTLPQWVTDELSLSSDSTFRELGFVTQMPTPPGLIRIQNFLAEVLRARAPEIEEVLAIAHPWQLAVDPAAVPWRVRTRNRLTNARILSRLDKIEELTFGDLARVPQMGPMLILDFLATLEAAEHYMNSPVLSEPVPTVDERTPPSDSLEEALQNQKPPPLAVPEEILEALKEDWVDKVSLRDPRFARLLPPIRGTLFEAIDALTSGLDAGRPQLELLPAISASLPAISASLPAIRHLADFIRALPLETALRELMVALLGKDDARVDALLARFHWNGEATASTLEMAGQSAGVTRERIRQLEQRILTRLAGHQCYLPQVERAMSLLAERAPFDSLSAASVLLQQEGISKAPFHPKSLLAVASSLHRTPLVHLESHKGMEALVRERVSPYADQILRIAFRQLSQVGTTNVAEVIGEASASGFAVTEAEAIELLKLYAGGVFTYESWFYCPTRPHSNLLTQFAKMLAVVSPIGIATLREGAKRALRFRRISGHARQTLVVPPKAALLAYLRGHSDFAVGSDELVRYAKNIDYRRKLPAAEQIIVDVLRESPFGVLDRLHLQEACVARGLNRNTFAVMSTYSPVLESLGFGLWTLRGRVVDPATIAVLRESSTDRQRERRVVDHGWTGDGRLWIAFTLPDNPMNTLYHIPSAVRRFLTAPEYPAYTENGVACGRIRLYENANSAGYAPFLRQSGADEDDIMVAEFDLAVRTVVLRLTDDEQLEELVGSP